MTALNLIKVSFLVLLSRATVLEYNQEFTPSKYDQKISRKAYKVDRSGPVLRSSSDNTKCEDLGNYQEIQFNSSDFCELDSAESIEAQRIVHYRFKFLEKGYGRFGLQIDSAGLEPWIYAICSVDASINGKPLKTKKRFGDEYDEVDVYLKKARCARRWYIYFSVNQGTRRQFSIAHSPPKIRVSPYMSILSGEVAVSTECMPMEAVEITPWSPTRAWRRLQLHVDPWEKLKKIDLFMGNSNMTVISDKRRLIMPVKFYENNTLILRRSTIDRPNPLENFLVGHKQWGMDRLGNLKFYMANGKLTKFVPRMYRMQMLPAYRRQKPKDFDEDLPEASPQGPSEVDHMNGSTSTQPPTTGKPDLDDRYTIPRPQLEVTVDNNSFTPEELPNSEGDTATEFTQCEVEIKNPKTKTTVSRRDINTHNVSPGSGSPPQGVTPSVFDSLPTNGPQDGSEVDHMNGSTSTQPPNSDTTTEFTECEVEIIDYKTQVSKRDFDTRNVSPDSANPPEGVTPSVFDSFPTNRPHSGSEVDDMNSFTSTNRPHSGSEVDDLNGFTSTQRSKSEDDLIEKLF